MMNRFEQIRKKITETLTGPFASDDGGGDLTYSIKATPSQLNDIIEALELASYTCNILLKTEEAVDE